MTTELRFFKLEDRWFADVPGHTLAENEMVAGSDDFLNACDAGTGNVVIEMSDQPTGYDICHLKMLDHNQYGATYSVNVRHCEAKEGPWQSVDFGVQKLWICNVTHDVLGEHPRNIYIQKIK